MLSFHFFITENELKRAKGCYILVLSRSRGVVKCLNYIEWGMNAP